MLSHVRATVLVENTTSRPDLTPEHGVALWIEADGVKVLFDTGSTGVVRENAATLGIDLSDADAIVLSHRHHDHTGGLDRVLDIARRARVHAHPSFGAGIRSARLRLSPAPETVVPGIHTTGEVERVTDFEGPRTPSRHFPDDQALYLETARGIVVVVGCAHAGIVNTLRHVAKLARTAKLHALVGGMHLLRASQVRCRKMMQAFREIGLDIIGPCHCTGKDVISQVEREFPAEFVRCQTGTVLVFGANDG